MKNSKFIDIFMFFLFTTQGCRASKSKNTFAEDAAFKNVELTTTVFVEDASSETKTENTIAEIRSQYAPPLASQWALSGLRFEAPKSQIIVAALSHDFDQDHIRDVVAYTQKIQGGGGELRWYQGHGNGTLLPGQPFVESNVEVPPKCIAQPLMKTARQHSMVLDLKSRCSDRTYPFRQLAWLSFVPIPSFRWTAILPELPIDWNVFVDFEAHDTDGDDIDDPTFTFALEGNVAPFENTERFLIRLSYLNRPFELIRNRQEPEASFRAVAQTIKTRALQKRTASSAIAMAQKLRLIYAMLCNDERTFSLKISPKHLFECNESKAIEDSFISEIKAHLLMQNIFAAVHSYEDMDRNGIIRHEKIREDLEKQIQQTTSIVIGKKIELRASIKPIINSSSWRSIAFEDDALLVYTRTGTIRIQLSNLEESVAKNIAWPKDIEFHETKLKFHSLRFTCNQFYATAEIHNNEFSEDREKLIVPLPILSPVVHSRCLEDTIVPFQPISVSSNGLYGFAEHALIFVPQNSTNTQKIFGSLLSSNSAIEGDGKLGSPRSLNGDWSVLATRFGILRRNERSSPFQYNWIHIQGFDGQYKELRDCVVSNQGSSIACVYNSKIILVEL